ncbi:interphotoreceptor matrix proteoglycan 1-like [Aplochiton taeniatus]
MLLKTGLLLTIFVITLQASQIKDPYGQDLSVLRDVKYRHFLESSRPIKHTTNIKTTKDMVRHRVKRATFFTTGVKVCPQDNMKEVVTSHRAYYKLRVCQEAIWEAFRVFLDRVPSSEEYRHWLFSCQHDNLCLDDLARNFSGTQEHLDMVAKMTDFPNTLPENGGEDQEYPEQIVEFSVTIVNPGYSELLGDPEAPLHRDITQDLHDKMLHVFNKLPGFKEIRVLGFRSEDVSMSYAVVFNGDSQNGHEAEGTLDPSLDTDVTVTGPRLKDMVAKALSQETSLPVDMQSLRFKPVGDVDVKAESLDTLSLSPDNMITINPLEASVTPLESLFPTVAFLDNSIETFTVKPETHTYKPFFPDIFLEASTDPGSAPPPREVMEEPSPMEALEEVAVDNTEEAVTEPKDQPTVLVAEKEDIKPVLEEVLPPIDAAEPDEMKPEGGLVEAAPAQEGLSPPKLDEPWVTETIATPDDLPSPGEDTVQAEEGVEPPSEPEEPEVEVDEEEPVEGPVTPASGDFPSEDVRDMEQTEASETVEEGSGSGFPSETDEHPHESTAPPALRQMSTPLIVAADKSKELVVFFSLRVTNMMFSDGLFNKSSPEYRSLENTFLELTQLSEPRNSPHPGASSKSGPKRQTTLASIPLLPYLQSNLTGFKQLEILNFRNGSVVVNSKMKLDKPVPYNVTEAVHCVLEDFCNAASKRLDIEIDSRSLDIEPADQADPCKFLACFEFSRCVVNSWTGEAECVCDPGFSTKDDSPCQSTCSLEPNYCFNGGICEIIQGHGATCRCPVGKYWHYHGERCTDLVSMPVDPPLIVACLVGSLIFVCAVIGILICINKKCIRTRKTVTLVHTLAPYAFENTLRVNPVFENDDGTLTQVSTLQYTPSSGSSLSQPSEQGTLPSVENIHLSIEIPRQLYTTRSEKLVSEMVDFHHCIPHNETWRPPNEYRTCCLLRTSDNECFDVTVL